MKRQLDKLFLYVFEELLYPQTHIAMCGKLQLLESIFNWQFIADPTNHRQIDYSIKSQLNIPSQTHEGNSYSSNKYMRNL